MAKSSAALIGGAYTVEFGRKIADAGHSGVFAAHGNDHSACMAVPVHRGAPARAQSLSSLTSDAPIANLLTPLAHGPALLPTGDIGYFVICPAPPGPSLQTSIRPWTETELIEQLIKPVALVLAALQARALTHRAIRPDNLFQAAPGTPVVLGCAWAAPPASQQPAWVEPPYSATCMPAGRGDGSIADDVYALGAVLLALALGLNPVDGLSDDAVLRSKRDEGSYAALAATHRLPGAIAELARGMLADDPDHRPSPSLLATPAAARARRVAARPMRRAARPIEIGAQTASTACALAHVLQGEPEAGLVALRNGSVDRWLRRVLNDTVAAGSLDEAVRLRDAQAAVRDKTADPWLLARAIAILDPLAPLVWRSVVLWLDGLGPALDHCLHHAPEKAAFLTEIATGHVAQAWLALRNDERTRPAWMEGRDIRKQLASQSAQATTLRLCYSLNQLAPCDSPLLTRYWTIRLADLLPAIEAEIPAQSSSRTPLLDDHITAFILARRDERLHGDIGRLASSLPPDDALAPLRLLSLMQAKLHPAPLPHLCTWATEAAQAVIRDYRSRSRRSALASEVAQLAAAGQLPALAALLDDTADRMKDAEGYSAAQARVVAIEDMLTRSSGETEGDYRNAMKIGQDVAVGLSAFACLVALAVAVFA